MAPAVLAKPPHVHGTSGVFGDFLVGRFASAQSDPDIAAASTLRALEGNRADAELLRQAFLASAVAGRPEAIGLARLLPNERFAGLLLADAAVRSGDWAEVELRARGLPRDGLSDVLRPLLIAWAEQAQGHTDHALAILQSEIGSSQFTALYSLHAALIADLAGRDRMAAQFYAGAHSAFGPPSLRLAQALASFAARHGRNGEALGALAEATDGAPELEIILPAISREMEHSPVRSAAAGIAEAYLAAAGSLQQQSQTQACALLLRFALDLRPDLTPARLLLGDLLAADRRPYAALAALNEIPPNDALTPLVQLHRAELRRETGDSAAAIAILDGLARQFPQTPLPLARKAEILRAKGKFADAASAYDVAITRLPPQPKTGAWALFYGRAVARDQMGDWTDAQADLQHALALSPDQPLVQNYLGYSWADRNIHLSDARRMIEKAMSAQPNDGAIVDSLGWVLLREGDLPRAIQTLEHASELQPVDATINGHLGDAYAAAGRRLEAVYQWRRALALHPEPAAARELKAKLDDQPGQSAVVEASPAAAGE